MSTVNTREPSQRIISLDQFRGYTVLGMLFVNFVGHFSCIADIFKHHNTYCSYADTIMPQFLFAVGFSYRLTLLRHLADMNSGTAFGRVVWRNLGLILIGVIVYHTGGKYETWEQLQNLTLAEFLQKDLRREPFQTLVHIALTSLFVMPVIARSARIRIAFAGISGAVYLLLSNWFYHDFVNAPPRGIDGGPLGFISWSIPLLIGSLAYDTFHSCSPRVAIARYCVFGVLVMITAYVMSCFGPASQMNRDAFELSLPFASPPFVMPPRDETGKLLQPNTIWTMSQRSGSVTYTLFAGGYSLVVYALFLGICEIGGYSLNLFRTLGSNALAAYILAEIVSGAVKPYAPKDAPLWYALGIFGVYLMLNWLILRYLELKKLFLRL